MLLSSDKVPTTGYVLLEKARSVLSSAMVEYDGKRVPFLFALRDYYQNLPEAAKVDDSHLSVEIKRRFADELIEYLCRPFNLLDDQCVATAIVATRSV